MDQEICRILSDPAARRFWLLYKALECVPLDQAIDLARKADDFGTGEPQGSRQQPPVDAPLRSPPESSHQAGQPLSDLHQEVGESRLGISADQRERLIERFADGSSNSELAAEFGLSPRQVQGLRMSVLRKSSQPRGRASQAEPVPQAPERTSLEEVIRFLRQQDDVVVRNGEHGFLLNGRFRLEAAELVARANKIRSRQGKALFETPTDEPANPRPNGISNGHPMFWNSSDATHAGNHSRSNGSAV